MTEYECAYCWRTTEFCGRVLTKWGMAYSYECPKHGAHYVMTDPVKVQRGHITPCEGRHVEA